MVHPNIANRIAVVEVPETAWGSQSSVAAKMAHFFATPQGTSPVFSEPPDPGEGKASCQSSPIGPPQVRASVHWFANACSIVIQSRDGEK